MTPPPLRIDVFSDIACPWCYIGKRRLRAAIGKVRPGSVHVKWHAFELRPDMPERGLPAISFYAHKFGGEHRRKAIFDHVAEVGAREGIHFVWDRMQHAPNTRLAHRAVKIAGAAGAADAAVEALFCGHFEEGADVGNLDDIVALFEKHGVAVDGDRLRDKLASGEGLSEVLADEMMAQELGIDGVPFFIADDRLVVSGAQPAEIFGAMLDEAARTRTVVAAVEQGRGSSLRLC